MAVKGGPVAYDKNERVYNPPSPLVVPMAEAPGEPDGF
jgi:hypothetical protein